MTMLKRLVATALILYLAMPTFAQVEFKSEPVVNSLYDLKDEYEASIDDAKDIAEFMFLTEKSNYCESYNMASPGAWFGSKYTQSWGLAFVCVFEDPRNGAFILYTHEESTAVVDFMVMYSDQIVATRCRSCGWGNHHTLPDLLPGEYKVVILINQFPWRSVMFSIPDLSD